MGQRREHALLPRDALAIGGVDTMGVKALHGDRLFGAVHDAHDAEHLARSAGAESFQDTDTADPVG